MAGNKFSGRKTKKVETEAAIEAITEQALLKLARSKVNQHLNKELTFKQAKDIALPIVLKGMTQKVGGDSEAPVPILVKFMGDDNNRDSK